MSIKHLARAVALLATVAGLSATYPAIAAAAPTEGPAGEAFYTPPSPLPAGPQGTLIWYHPMSVNLGVSLPAVKAWRVLYKSTNEVGGEDAVTGTVIVPAEAWHGKGPRPVVDYAEGTQGLGHQCAPSLQIEAGTEYDGGAIVAALLKGYAVVVTDYQGYTNGSTPAYIAGASEGHAVLDIAKAAQELPEAGIGPENPVVLWGYSQGGQAAGWAGELLSEYAPSLHVVGDAVGGVPGNLAEVATFSEGAVGAAFALDSILGLAAAYEPIANPKLFLSELLSKEGLEKIEALKSECAIESLARFHDASFKELSKNHQTFAEVLATNPLVSLIVEAQQLGKAAIPVPVYHYHGLRDEFVPVKQDVELHYAWCSLGVKDDFQLYPGDHLLTDPTAIPYVMRWIEERLEGKEAPSTCGRHQPGSPLPEGARLTPQTGDLIIPIPAWQLSGSVTDAKLGVSLAIPAGSTLSAEGDLTNGTLTASLSVPPIDESVNFFGLIPLRIKADLTQAGPISGTDSLANSGVLSLKAVGKANLTVESVGISFFNLNLDCQTKTPIELPIDVEEPANALYTGSISLQDTVTIPQFTGCPFIYELLTDAVLSGPGNKVSITSTPPPPIVW